MDHGHSYKLLFFHPEMVADVLIGFVGEGWFKPWISLHWRRSVVG